MTHLALARKYRPQRFADLVGQDAVRSTLERAVATDRVAHAYLFAGPRGSGKTTTARLIAKALNCERRKEGASEPCNECPTCSEITGGSSLDVLEIDGASNRGIEEIRNLRENVKYAPSGGKSKIYIIDEAHQLTDYAWNALLKTLEEPPAHVRFVFATTEPLEIPETIASRCQVFEFRRLRSEELVAHLATVAAAERVDLDPQAAALIARASEGSVRDALSRLDQVMAASTERITEAAVAKTLGFVSADAFFELGAALAARDPKSAIEIADRLYDRGLDVEGIADGLMRHVRSLLLVAVDPSLARLIDASPSERERFARESQAFEARDLSAMAALVLEARSGFRRAEAPRALLEVLLVELATLPTAAPIGQLLDRLEALESRLGGGPREPPRPTGSDRGGATSAHARAPHRGAPPAPASKPGPAPRRSPRGEEAAEVEPASDSDTERPAAITGPGGGDAYARFHQVVERVKQRKLLLGTCLEEARLLDAERGTLRIALAPEHSFHRAMLEMKENRELLRQECERQYGPGVSLLFVTGGPGGAVPASPPGPEQPSAAPDESGSAADRPESLDRGVVQRIVEMFDGEILEPGASERGAR